jgi:hypothetical protein
MSKEMLPEKLSRDQGLGPEPVPLVIETNKEKRERLIVVFLIAVGIGILVLTSIILLPHVNSLGSAVLAGVRSTSDSGSGALEATTALAPSFKATDGKGNVIDISNGVAVLEEITISGYSNSKYSTKLLCRIDMLPVYCDGSPIVISGLPAGKHTFTITEPSSGDTIVRVFSWSNIPP